MKHKHKRLGRPKGSKNKQHKQPKQPKQLKQLIKNRKMGNKSRAIKESKGIKAIKGKKGSKEPIVKKGYVAQVFPFVESHKFLGYCECNGIVMETDLISKFIYICAGCGRKARIKALRKALDSPTIDRSYDKEEVYHHIDTLPLNEATVDPKEFKVVE